MLVLDVPADELAQLVGHGLLQRGVGELAPAGQLVAALLGHRRELRVDRVRELDDHLVRGRGRGWGRG